MAWLSNCFLVVPNTFTLVLSFPSITTGLYLRAHVVSECERYLQLRFLVLGIFLLVFSLVGIISACCRATPFLWAYVTVVFVLVVGMSGFIIFMYVVSHGGDGYPVPGTGYKEYRLGDYAGWMQSWARNTKNWRLFQSCIVESRVCGRLDGAGRLSAEDFHRLHLAPVESGCCKPPSYCGFEFVNATFWERPESGLAAPDVADCRAWSNSKAVRCFGCDACKAGVLATFKNQRNATALVNGGVLAFLVIVFVLGCCAVQQNRRSSTRHGPYYYGAGQPWDAR